MNNNNIDDDTREFSLQVSPSNSDLVGITNGKTIRVKTLKIIMAGTIISTVVIFSFVLIVLHPTCDIISFSSSLISLCVGGVLSSWMAFHKKK